MQKITRCLVFQYEMNQSVERQKGYENSVMDRWRSTKFDYLKHRFKI